MTTLLKSTDLGPGGLITPRIEFGTPTFDNEIFGPMAIISLSHSLDESINMANNSEYGLSCSIYTSSKKSSSTHFGIFKAESLIGIHQQQAPLDLRHLAV